jgi:hypothetical protein
MTYSDLFDGEEHWLDLNEDPGWTKPYMRVTDAVVCEPQPKGSGEWDPELINLVSVPVDFPVETSWGIEDGWSAFAVMIQQIGQLLSPYGDNQLEATQMNTRDERTWQVTSTYYRVFWKGEERVDGI